MTLQSFQVVKCSLSKYLFLASLHSCWRRHRVTMSRPIQLTYKVIMPRKDFFLQIWHFQLNTCLWLMTVTEAGSICICQAHYSKLRRFAPHSCPQEYSRKGNGSGCRPVPSRIKDFQSWDFYLRDFTIEVQDLSVHVFCEFYTFWTTYLFVKYIRQTKVSSKMKVKVFEDVEYDKSFHYLNQM